MKKQIFKGKTIENLYEEIYAAQSINASEISEIIEQLTLLVKDASDAAVLAPMIGAMLGNKIRNTQLLIELTKIIQRTIEAPKSPDSKLNTDVPHAELVELLSSFKTNEGI